MSLLKNLSIANKILCVLVPICFIGVAGVGFVSFNYKQADTAYSEFIAKDTRAEINVAIASQRLVALSYDAYQIHLRDPGSSGSKSAAEDYAASKDRLFSLLSDARGAFADEAPKLEEFETSARDVVRVTDQAVSSAIAERHEESLRHLTAADEMVATLLPKMRQWINQSSAQIDAKSERLSSQTANAIITSLVGLGVLFASGIAVAMFVSRRGITGPLAELQNRMRSLADGENDQPIGGTDRKDEIGSMAIAVSVFRENALERKRLEEEADANRNASEQEKARRELEKANEAADNKAAVDGLARGLQALAEGKVTYRISQPFVATLDELRINFNQSAETLQSTLKAVGENARAIDAGASEIQAAADDLSKRTEQQAASVEETAAALEQITTTVSDSARRAQEVGLLVAKAHKAAEKSGAVVNGAITAMGEIDKSSSEITNIITVIDEIAFQTNLLALNAGVEAARAGEAGKGFAVVAQEVRELAQRSARAAKEIKNLISVSRNHVERGVALVGETGTSLNVILSEVQGINHHVLSIVEAAKEQSVGLKEINTAVNTMDQGTQQNAAMVEQSTAASHSLAKEAAALTALLGQFDVGYDSEANHREGDYRPATQNSYSPAQSLVQRVVRSFSGQAVAKNEWQEF